MAKNIHMIAPFDVLTGNLGSKQDLRYKLHDNKAYEAPDGVAGAKNYRTRYVGVRRADGKTYFMVKTRSTSNLNKKSRTTMAILGSIAAIRSAIQYGDTILWGKLKAIYEYRMAHGGDAAGNGITFNKWLDYWLRYMLQYKMDELSLTASGITALIQSPFCSYDDDGKSINQAVFAKFVPVLTVDSTTILFTVNGKQYAAKAIAWNSFVDNMNNDNYVEMFTPFNIPAEDDAAVTYNGLQLYTAAGVAVKSNDAIIANEKYTTIAPTA